MRRRFKKVFDISGIVVLLLVLTVFVWLSSDSHIYFSRNSGYYDEAFNLEIFGGRGVKYNIYYTLDGSEPTQDDFLYDKDTPIYIEDATNHENRYAARTDVGVVAYDDTPYEAPDYRIDKCNVVRASVFDEEGNCLESITGIYFIDFQNKSGYEGLYTASIVTDPENLFDVEDGIYTEGSGRDANYEIKGPEWEREAAVTIFDSGQRQILTQKCGIRIKGGNSRKLAQKSIRCYAREEYCGDNKFEAELFRKGHLPQRITFYSGGNDYYCKVKDPMIHELTEGRLSFATMRFIPCAVFLNGEYWGVYYISEDYDDDYISDHYEVKKEDVVLIKAGELKEGDAADLEDYETMRQFMIRADMSLPENYETACQIIDMNSYIDYFALQTYVQRYEDWPRWNFALWKTRENEGSEYGDGRWRWMLYDLNSSGMDTISFDYLIDVLYEDEMFASLFENEEFRRRYAERILYIGKEILTAQNCSQFLEEHARTMTVPLIKSNTRFYPAMQEDEINGARETLTAFFENRYDEVWDFLVKNMGEDWLRENGIEK